MKKNFVKKSEKAIDTISKSLVKATKKSSNHIKTELVDRLDNVRLVRGKVIAWILLIAALLLATGLQYTWYQSVYSTEAYTTGGSYAEATTGDINTLNPIYASTNSESVVSKLLFSGLFSFDTSGNLKGDLAKSVKKSSDGKTYTVTLREGVKWHDGTDFTIDDVLFTANVIKDPKSRSLFNTGLSSVDVKQVSGTEVSFVLPRSYSAFLETLTFPILPKHVLEGVEVTELYGNDFSFNPIGTGPFKFNILQRLDSGGENIVHLTANESYYKGSPKLDKFLIHTYANEKDVLTAINSSQVSATASLQFTLADQVNTKIFNLKKEPINSGVFAFLNLKSDLLKNARIRQALQHGIDTVEIREQIGASLALDYPVLENQTTFNLNPLERNKETSSKLLKQAGYTLKDGKLVDKKDSQPTLRIVTVRDLAYEKVVEALKKQVEDLGFIAEVEIFNPSLGQDFLKTVIQPRNYDILVYEVELGYDPDMFAYYHSSQISSDGLNLSNYSSAVSDDLLLSARTTTSDKLRQAKYESFVKNWSKDVPAIGIYQTELYYFYNKSVHSFDEDNEFIKSTDRFSDVIYWASNQKSVYKTP